MKVKIGQYPNFVGPYQLAKMIPYISEDTADKVGDWLADTWLNKFLNWIYEKRNRKIKIHIDPWDTWSMDHTLALIILPMLKQLQATKHGSCYVDEEDVPEYMRHSFPEPDHNGNYGNDSWVHYKWEWVLSEMIWAFEQIVKDEIYDLVDISKYNEYNERIQNGTRLFGKYYRGLWD